MINMAAIAIGRTKQWLWTKLSSAMHLQYRLHSGITVKISSFADWCIYNDIFVSGEYDEAILSAIQRAGVTGSFYIVDIGANVGFFTLRVFDLIARSSIQFPRVQCLLVEGSPHLKRAICDHVGQLQRDGVEIEVIIGLAGKRSGTAYFEFEQSESGNQVVAEPSAKSRSLAYYNLDERLAEVPAINLFKCDIEGSEIEVLNNYPHLLRKTDVAVFEFHEPRCPAAFGKTEVMKAGFKTSRVLYDQGHTQTLCFER